MHTSTDSTDYAALVALDCGDTTHALAWLMTGEPRTRTQTLPATPEQLHRWLEALREACGGRPVALALEAGRNGLLHALCEHASWLTIHPVHPATSARFRLAFAPSGATDDMPEAETLLALLRPDTPATRELAALVEQRRHAVDERTALVNRLIRLLKRVYPQARTLAGEDPAAPLALAFLRRFPSLESARKAGPARLREFYRRHNVRCAERIAQRIARLSGARAITTDEAILRPAALELSRLLVLLEVLSRHIGAHDAAIARAFAAHPKAEIFESPPGAGPVLAPRLPALFGERTDRHPDAASLQKYAGVAPVRQRSQGRLRVHWRRAAPKFLRQSLVEWAGQSVPRCLCAREYYRGQKAAGKRHHAILRALAFKWVRILWRCWKDHVPYDEARYLAALARRRAPPPGPA